MKELFFDASVIQELVSGAVLKIGNLSIAPTVSFSIHSKTVKENNISVSKFLLSDDLSMSGELPEGGVRMIFNLGAPSLMKYDFYRKEIENSPFTSNIIFASNGFIGTDILTHNKLSLKLGINISQRQLEFLAEEYPTKIEAFLRRLRNGESFMLSEKSIPFKFQMNELLFQLENSCLLGTAENSYVGFKIMELFLLQIDAFNNEKEKPITIKKSADREKILEAANIIITNYENPPSIFELGKQVGINRKNLQYGFKEIFDVTIFEYLFNYKMEKAKHLLLNGQNSIAAISHLCGYEYTSHFCTAFKRKFKCSPTEFRNLGT